jgi:FkbM family methyltransferase
MSFFKQRVKPAWRIFSSFTCAVRSKIVAQTVGRKPTKTCQIPELFQIVTDRIDANRGVFVEVGAYDGERFSNTSWLADNGWRGLYVEPSKQFSRLCRLRHCLNDVTVLNAAAGEKDTEATLMQIGSLSTMSMETFEEYDRIPWAKKQIQKECKEQKTQVHRLDSILQSHQIAKGFELLVVDVEGFEESVFAGFDLQTWQPNLVIVELCDVHPDFSDNQSLVESARRVREKILLAGYVEVFRDHINTVFQRYAVESAETEGRRSAAA